MLSFLRKPVRHPTMCWADVYDHGGDDGDPSIHVCNTNTSNVSGLCNECRQALRDGEYRTVAR